jgi:hypothetical protein
MVERDIETGMTLYGGGRKQEAESRNCTRFTREWGLTPIPRGVTPAVSKESNGGTGGRICPMRGMEASDAR